MRKACLLAAALLAAVLAGCSAYHTMPIDPASRADCFLTCKNNSGLYLASESLFDTGKSTLYLGFDLKETGVIPLVLYATNRGSCAFSLLRDEVTLILSDGTELKPLDIAQTFSQAGMEVQIDFVAKDFFRGRKGVRLGADSNLSGVVFFMAPAGRRLSSLSNAVLNLDLTKEKGEGEAESTRIKAIVDIE